MKQGKNLIGWTTPKEGERSVRNREHGLEGQEIWYRLQDLGFVHETNFSEQLTSWEKKLKNWLIWGYWEEDR